MEVERSSSGGVQVFRITGRLDSTTSLAFESKVLALLCPEVNRVALDFTGVDYVSSAGLRVVLLAAKKAKALAGGFAIFGMAQPVQHVFQMSGFSRIIPLFPTEAEAVAAAGAASSP